MGNVKNYMPWAAHGHKVYPENIAGIPLNTWGDYWYVDGNKSTGGTGESWDDAWHTIQNAVDAADDGDVIFIKPKTPGIWDPVAYAEDVVIPYATPHLTLMGVSPNNAWGSLPMIDSGTTTAAITVRAPGCRISGLGMSNNATTGGGVNLDDDSSTKSAYGTQIDNCYFYECPKAGAATGGGGVWWSATGGAWQVRILNNYFMACGAGISLLGTTASRPTDVLIQGNTFASWVNTQVDCDISLGAGSGVQGLVIDSNYFASVDGVNAAFAEDHYMNLTGCEGIVSNNVFAAKSGEDDTPLSFGASTHTAGKIPATVRFVNNTGEVAVGSSDKNDSGIFYRTD